MREHRYKGSPDVYPVYCHVREWHPVLGAGASPRCVDAMGREWKLYEDEYRNSPTVSGPILYSPRPDEAILREALYDIAGGDEPIARRRSLSALKDYYEAKA